MPQKPYNTSAKLTALLPETVRRQSLSANKVGKKAIVFVDGSNWYHKLKNLLTLRPPRHARRDSLLHREGTADQG
jgi:hypothetical protein